MLIAMSPIPAQPNPREDNHMIEVVHNSNDKIKINQKQIYSAMFLSSVPQ